MSRAVLVFGWGFTARALAARLKPHWRVIATSRKPETRAALPALGVEPLDPGDPAALGSALMETDALLVAAPPSEAEGCPALRALGPAWPAFGPRWIGYLSTTGVYGDREGGWVREASPPAPLSPQGRLRVEAEAGWAALAGEREARFAAFRLPGIYGPGRSALDRVRAGQARRWTKAGQVFSRIHVDDLADALARAMARPEREGPYVICDDEPAAPADVTLEACRLLGRPAPPEEPLDPAALSPMARRFWAESKRAPNARAKAALSWRPRYPSYREGLAAILQAEGG